MNRCTCESFVERSLLRCLSCGSGFSRELFSPHRCDDEKLAAEAAPTKAVRPALSKGIGAKQGGYTLIEVIVAFAVLALALTLLLGTLTGASRQVRRAADAGRAALHAQSLLDQTGIGESLRPGHTQGDFENGRYRWAMDIAPFADPSQTSAPAPTELAAPQLMQVTLSVQWGDGPGQSLRLRSLRLALPGLEAPPP